jgi:hypothetical protein
MEPMRICESSRSRKRPDELVLELTRHATALRASLPPGMVLPLCDPTLMPGLYPGLPKPTA